VTDEEEWRAEAQAKYDALRASLHRKLARGERNRGGRPDMDVAYAMAQEFYRQGDPYQVAALAAVAIVELMRVQAGRHE
jgi:hypothetical protein